MADDPGTGAVTEEELAAQEGEALPDREVMSIVDLGVDRPVPLEGVGTDGESEFDKYSV